jgi:thymidylate synthase
MLCIEGRTAQDVWVEAASRLQRVTLVQESRDQSTRELAHVAFTIADPRQRIVFARPMNPAFAIAEVLWLLAGANSASFLCFWNSRMRNLLDEPSSRFHGAYGHRLGSQPRLDPSDARELRDPATLQLDQIYAAYEALKHIQHSRQVVLQIWDSVLDLPDPKPRSKDIPCSICSHLLVRNGRLEWLQVMRSNDLIWGTPYNVFQWTCVQEIMAGWLDLDVGPYNHISDSLHVYERHWLELDAQQLRPTAIPINQADLRVASYAAWSDLWSRLVATAQSLTRHESADALIHVPLQAGEFPDAYAQWIAVLTAEALRKRGHGAAAREAIEVAGEYWKTSWLQWVGAVTARATRGTIRRVKTKPLY